MSCVHGQNRPHYYTMLGTLPRFWCSGECSSVPAAESVGAAPVTCDGFAWIGQPFTSCDRCGRPFWEHTHQRSLKAGAGPFDRDPWELVPILVEQAHSIRLKWDDTYRAAAVSQPVEGDGL